MCTIAAKYGQWHIIKWLRQQHHHSHHPATEWDANTCMEAAANGIAMYVLELLSIIISIFCNGYELKIHLVLGILEHLHVLLLMDI